MNASPVILRLLLIIWLTAFVNGLCISQERKAIKQVAGKIIDFDDLNKVIDWQFAKGHRNYYFDVFHFRVFTSLGDTITLGKIFGVRTDLNSLSARFGFKKDSVYIFDVISINPCDAGFPAVRGCLYDVENNEWE